MAAPSQRRRDALKALSSPYLPADQPAAAAAAGPAVASALPSYLMLRAPSSMAE